MGRSKRGARRKPKSNPRGVLDVNVSGYGFVKTPEGEFFIPAERMGGAFDGDLVEVSPVPEVRSRAAHGRERRSSDAKGPRRPRARIVRVIDRAHDTVVGRYEVAEPFGVVVPADPRIKHDVFTMRADAPDVPDGALVRVRITTFPGRHTAATGVVEEVVAQAGADVSIDLIIARHKLETTFSEGALQQAAQATVDGEGALASGYRDLRDRLIVTIDPADARDFDDAVSLAELAAPTEEGARWRLGVHIADVSHYVPWNSSIDLDARRRATSTYLADRVIPMLPEALSNDVCSLRPGVERRTMTVDMFLDDDAQVLSVDAYPALIRSSRRFSYDEVQSVLDARTASDASDGADAGDSAAAPDPVDARIESMLFALSRIARMRNAQRVARGGLEFASAEAKARLDDDGHCVGVDVRRKTDATQLIEEAMILANESVARFLSARHMPCIYRVHEAPDADNLAALVPVMQEFSWWDGIDAERFCAADPTALAAVLAASAGKPEGELVSMLLLRAQKRAVYRPVCEGHYGLALDAYAHFTSPIRRYPDLVVHRMLRAALTRKPKDFKEQADATRWLSEHSSDMERVADAAARESQECKIIEYLQDFVGMAFSAVVSGVAAYGIYARLDNTAEGFVPVRALGDDYFLFDPAKHCLTGADTGRRFRLGQRVAVVIHAADPASRTLDLRLAKPARRGSDDRGGQRGCAEKNRDHAPNRAAGSGRSRTRGRAKNGKRGRR